MIHKFNNKYKRFKKMVQDNYPTQKPIKINKVYALQLCKKETKMIVRKRKWQSKYLNLKNRIIK